MAHDHEQRGGEGKKEGARVGGEKGSEHGLEREEQHAEDAVVENAEDVVGERCDAGEIVGLRRTQIAPDPREREADHKQHAGQHREPAAQRAHAVFDEARDR